MRFQIGIFGFSMSHYTSSQQYSPQISSVYIYIVPGPVAELNYEEDTDTSVNITWKPPKEPNDVISAYFVEHGVYQNEPTTSVTIYAGRPAYTVIRALGKLVPFHSILYCIACVLASECTIPKLRKGLQVDKNYARHHSFIITRAEGRSRPKNKCL